MAIKKDAKLFKPETVDERYLHFLLTGEGKVEELPSPTTIGEQYLYHMCVDGVKVVNSDATVVGGGASGEGASEQPQAVAEEAKPYVQANVKSDAGNQNYLGIIYDGGEAKETRPTDVSVKFRFKLKDIQGEKPLTAGIRLVNSEKGEKDVLDAPNDYAIQKAGVIQNPEYGKEYVIEEKYQPTDTNGKPFGQRYIRPFLMTGKSIKDVTHSIEILEATLTVDGIAHDLTTSVVDFAPLNGEGSVKVVTPEPTVVAPATPVAGKDGKDGKDGSVWFNGVGVPVAEKTVGVKANDYYLQDNGDVWKFVGGEWKFTTINIKGEKGESAVGGNGGSIWFNGVGDPVKEKTVGVKANDYYLQDDGKVWKFVGGEWKFTTINLKGAKGEDGEDGVSVVAQPQVTTKEVKYLNIIANSDAYQQNFLDSMYDASKNKANNAEVEFVVKLKKEGTSEQPKSIGVKLFANDTNDKTDIKGAYQLTKDNIIEKPEYDKEYTIKASFDEKVGEVALNSVSYLKPFLMLNKASNDDAKQIAHALEIHKAVIKVNGVEHDLLDTVDVWYPMKKDDNTKYKREVLTKKVEVPAEGQGTVVVASDSYKTFKGKKLTAIGDSITFGYDTAPTVKMANPWVDQLKEICGLRECVNLGISSSTVGEFANKNPMHSRWNQIPKDTNIIVFMGGTNDFSNGLALGTNDGKEGTDTLYGALEKTFKGIAKTYPTADVIVMTPLDFNNGTLNTVTGKNSKGATFEQFRNAIREVAYKYAFNVIDLQKIVGFTVTNEVQKPIFIKDGVHPTQEGANKIARKLGGYINNLL